MNRTPILFLNVLVIAACGLTYELLAGHGGELRHRRLRHAVLSDHRHLPVGSRSRGVAVAIHRPRPGRALHRSRGGRRPGRRSLGAAAVLRVRAAAVVRALPVPDRLRDRRAGRPGAPDPDAHPERGARLQGARLAHPQLRLHRIADRRGAVPAVPGAAHRPGADVAAFRISQRLRRTVRHIPDGASDPAQGGPGCASAPSW